MFHGVLMRACIVNGLGSLTYFCNSKLDAFSNVYVLQISCNLETTTIQGRTPPSECKTIRMYHLR